MFLIFSDDVIKFFNNWRRHLCQQWNQFDTASELNSLNHNTILFFVQPNFIEQMKLLNYCFSSLFRIHNWNVISCFHFCIVFSFFIIFYMHENARSKKAFVCVTSFYVKLTKFFRKIDMYKMFISWFKKSIETYESNWNIKSCFLYFRTLMFWLNAL